MKLKKIPYIYILFITCFINGIIAQKNNDYTLDLTSLDEVENNIIKAINYKKKFTSEKQLYTEVDSIISMLKSNGYYTILITKKNISKKKYKIVLSLGNKVVKAVLTIQNTSGLSDTLLGITKTNNVIEIPIENLSVDLKKISQRIIDNGSPFSIVNLQNPVIKKNILHANLAIQNTTVRNIDSIIIRGSNNFPKNYVKHLLKLNKGNLFTKKSLRDISTEIDNIKFTEQSKEPEVLFSKDSTIIFLHLKKRKANSFDGLINFTSNKNKSGITLNGYLDFNLVNTFKSGEEISLLWKNTGENREFLKIHTTIPYLFNTDLITKSSFDIYKQDSTFLNTKTTVAVSKRLSKKSSIEIGLSFENSNELQSDDNTLGVSNFTKSFIEARWGFKSLSSSQFNIDLQLGYGSRTTDSNKQKQYRFLLESSRVFLVTKKLHIFLKNSSGYLHSKEHFQNELFRAGGVNSIRGFDDESLFTSSYSFVNSEIRFLTIKKTRIYTVFDFGLFKDANHYKKLYSFGLGYAFKTSRNSIDINYVVKKSPELPLQLNTSKINVKILTFF